MRRAFMVGAAAAGIFLATAAPARADRAAHTYVIAIGYDGVPAGSDPALLPLRFADDDAIAFFELVSQGSTRAHLLTVIDSDTQRRLGAGVPRIDPPSGSELRAALTDVRQAINADALAGATATVYVYYAGHGTVSDGGESALALLDGWMTRQMLYDDVLGALSGSRVHLFVDACHAEAVVRPRDVQAQVVSLTADDLASYARTTLARFPNVGAVLASTRSAEAHEWDAYQGGIFTHELLSGLRGAADVNGDGRIEYSELAAFLSAANREVRDPRAHLDTVIHPPSADPRAAIVELGSWPMLAMLEAPSSRLDAFSVDDDRGEHLADVRAESGHPVHLVLPVGRTLYLRSAWGEAVVQTSPGQRLALEGAPFHESSIKPRGALEESLRRGLFATPYGPAYYRGFVDRAGDLVAVPLDAEPSGPREARRATHDPARPSTVLGWTAIGAAGAMTVGAGVFAVFALQARSDFDRTSLERPATEAADRYTRYTTVTAVFSGAALAAAGAGVYLLLSANRHAPVDATTAFGVAAGTVRF